MREGAASALSRRAVGHRTWVAQPSFSNTQITRAEMSSWPRPATVRRRFRRAATEPMI